MVFGNALPVRSDVDRVLGPLGAEAFDKECVHLAHFGLDFGADVVRNVPDKGGDWSHGIVCQVGQGWRDPRSVFLEPLVELFGRQVKGRLECAFPSVMVRQEAVVLEERALARVTDEPVSSKEAEVVVEADPVGSLGYPNAGDV